MLKHFDKPYDPKETEDKIYRLWEKSGFFNPDKLPGQRKKTFTITVPPPNITGTLHLGHALNATIQDILIRKKRMEGYRVLWLPGTDHAGIATQNVVEKDLKKQGITRHDIGREKFLEKIWEWKEKYGHVILDQFKKLGSSMDWSRTRFTMDADYQKAVKEAFLHYHKKGLIYQAERVISWCTRCGTSLSDLELEYEERKDPLYFIKYGPIELATVRLETKFGDTAVAVNPKDKRYKKYIGKEINIETIIGPAKIKVIADKAVDINFGTGAVKVTPAHDLTDFEIWQRHKNEIPGPKQVIDKFGHLNELTGPYQGMKIQEARDKIAKDMAEKGLLDPKKTDFNYKHNVATCYRCGTIIEPMLSWQWFLKMDGLAKTAIQAVKSGRVKFYPKRWEKIYFSWLNNIKDWCISRQIYWGHKIPLEGESDVLDTWFSSALWPFATLGWPTSAKASAGKHKNDLKQFYPTQVLSTARDIINLWVTRMVFSGFEFMKKEPFKDVVIHATILTKEGKRMSKSLGTGVNPMNLISQYGADATRFALIWQVMGNQDIHWSEEHVVAGKKFCNKIWNAARFVLSQTNMKKSDLIKPKPITAADKKILAKLEKIKRETNAQIDKYVFGQTLHKIYDFFWHDFCDQYIEASKRQMANDKLKKSTSEILFYVLMSCLKLLHPFMPFITEEIYQNLSIRDKKMLIIEKW